MRKAFLQLHGAVFLAGFTGILGRLITLNEGLLVWYRMLIAAITLWLLFYWQKKLKKLRLADLMQLLGVGSVVALHWVTFYSSIKYANVSVALVCFSSIGFFSAIFEPLILRKPFQQIELFLGLLPIAGIYLIFHFDPTYKTGIVIGIVSALLASIFSILNRRLVQRLTPETITLYEMTSGFLVLSLLMPFYLQQFPPGHLWPTASDWGWLLVLGWLCTVWAFNLSMHALKKISAFTVNLTYNLEPVYGIALAFAVYREDRQVSGAFYAGLALILLAVGWQTWLVYRREM